MKKNRFSKVALIILMILLTVDIGSRLLSNQSIAIAGSKIQYKVVSAKPINTPEQYEKLLNDMSNKGWTFNHVVTLANMIIFSK
ncbi:MAG: hypothetical protein ISS62_09765 [Desulfobacteraceae bacterium]|nr:hypothetical protein [Desulfobacteraceae bacterium]